MSFLELHVIQNFAPSNLNRDDTGSPKECEFGGCRRARISSQCQKRATRSYFQTAKLLNEEELGVRTKRAADIVKDHLVQSGKPDGAAALVALQAVVSLGVPEDKKRSGLTGYLLFLSLGELKNLSAWALENYETLEAEARKSAEIKEKNKEDHKAAKSQGAPKNLKAKLNGKCAADLALFGRMLADFPEDSVDAAAQVAHAISTHRVNVEFDYYTAVDDRKPDDNSGADMVGTVEFNSACYYRYANVSLGQLRTNLDGDDILLQRTVEAFVRGFALAVPTGKQNSMAAHNPPSFVMAVRRRSAPCNLSNAFVKPVRAFGSMSLIEASVKALDEYWGRLTAKFGMGEIEAVTAWTFDDHPLEKILEKTEHGPETLVAQTFDGFVQRACQEPNPQEKAA